MDLVCYVKPTWTPLIRPASATRPWMDDTPQSFAYRCLPLNIANAQGWEVLSPSGFEAIWDGGVGAKSITVKPDAGATPDRLPVSVFGQGVLTFHVEGIFRTPPGWNLWITGSPNRMKDGIVPLTGVVESDWSPYTFTMNWRFTRPGFPVRFEAMEPFCFIFPVQRAVLDEFAPRFAPIESDPALLERFEDWSRARNEFHALMKRDPPKASADTWQKHYFRGVDMRDRALITDHRTKLRLKPFDASATPQIPTAPKQDPRPTAQQSSPTQLVSDSRLRLALAKREWLLETLERQRALAPRCADIPRRHGIGPDEFLEQYYAPNRPVILAGEMAGWPALSRWTPDYLKAKVGARLVEYQGDRGADPAFEIKKEVHKRTAPFHAFMDIISNQGSGNNAYITAFNSARNLEALAVLHEDMDFLHKFLDPSAQQPHGMMWIGPAGTFTPLHHDLTNNLIAQVVGRKQVKILPASEVGRLYNETHVFSRISDLERPALDLAAFKRLVGARIYDVPLEAGDVLFMPLGWWHQVRSLTFSVTVTYTNFRWPNDAYASYPTG